MEKKHKPLLLIISSPSGAGKTTLIKAILAGDPNFILSTSFTTRKQREAEEEGRDYYFVDQDAFDHMVDKGDFFEYVNTYDKSYGTSKYKTLDLTNLEKDIIFDIDWFGAKQLIDNFTSDIVKIFIIPPSLEELTRRLTSRGTETEESLKLRIENAKKEIGHANFYDYLIVNEDINTATTQLKEIIAVERLKRTNYDILIKNLTK
jgi:guanylate kinase